MSQVLKTFLALFIVTLGSLIITGIISAGNDAVKATEYKDDIVQEIECSNMAPSVIDGCIRSTEENTKYTLAVNKITNDAGKVVACEILLDYKYDIPILHISTPHQKRGFAR